MNLLKETLQIMSDNGKTPLDVSVILAEDNTLSCTWEVFCKGAEEHFSNYDNGYGWQEVPSLAIVFKDGSWLERFEYDGSEGWSYKSTPTLKGTGVVESFTGERYSSSFVVVEEKTYVSM